MAIFFFGMFIQAVVIGVVVMSVSFLSPQVANNTWTGVVFGTMIIGADLLLNLVYPAKDKRRICWAGQLFTFILALALLSQLWLPDLLAWLGGK